MEVARITQEQAEKVALAAQIVKEWVEAWTDEDLKEMGASRKAVETDLAFSTTIIPLSQYYTQSERRKRNAKARIEEAWGVNWEDKLGEMLPPWPAEEFLRELARFAERNKAWDVAKALMENNIAERLAVRRAKKYKWLTVRDITEKAVVERKRLRGRKANNNEVVEEAETPTSKSPSPQPSNQPSNEPNSDLAGIPPNLEAGQEPESTLSLNSTAPQPLLNQLVKAEPSNPKDEELGQDKHLGKVGNAENVETSSRKSRTPSEGGRRKKRFRIDIPVINLDVEERVDKLKRKAKGEGEKNDALAVGEALRSLTVGEGASDKEVLRRRLEMLLGVSRAEIVEELES